MFVSRARINVNRRNAAKSTGPRTPEGKERSCANALKHGLCASVVVPEDAKLVQGHAEDFFRDPPAPESFPLLKELRS